MLADAIGNHLGSKSPYAFAPLEDLVCQEDAACSIDSLVLVSRHGARWPTIKHLNKYKKLSSEFSFWSHMFREEDQGLLTPRGESEMRSLGKRMRTLHQQLFAVNSEYHPHHYQLIASRSTRALQSASAFAQGLFGSERAFAISSENSDTDFHLRFHDNCPNHKRDKRTNMPDLQFLIDEVTERVARRFVEPQDIGRFRDEHMKVLWSACQFELSAFDVHNRSCAYFSQQDAQIIEYIKDVEDYWEKSFGRSINHEMTCLLGKDIAQSLAAFSKRFMFGHAETLIPLITYLELFQEGHHLGHDPKRDQKRVWRARDIAPFSANIAFVRKSCPNQEPIVQIYHNEKRMNISHLCPLTKDSFRCSFTEFHEWMINKAGRCDFDKICDRN